CRPLTPCWGDPAPESSRSRGADHAALARGPLHRQSQGEPSTPSDTLAFALNRPTQLGGEHGARVESKAVPMLARGKSIAKDLRQILSRNANPGVLDREADVPVRVGLDAHGDASSTDLLRHQGMLCVADE